MKKTKNALIAILLLAIFIAIFSTSVFAEEPEEAPSVNDTQDDGSGEDIQNTEDGLGAGAVIDPESDATDRNTPEDADDTLTDGGTEDDNPFEKIYSTVMNYSSEIFSALSFIGAIILTFLYKKGLFPLLQNALGGITVAVSNIKDNAEKAGSVSLELASEVSNRLGDTETCLKSLEDRLEQLSVSLDNMKESSDERERFKLILEGQIDMLYDIFISSALPQYQKEAVSKRVAELKEAIESRETTEPIS